MNKKEAISIMRKSLIAFIIAIFVVPVGAAYAFLSEPAAVVNGTKYSSWMGSIELVVTRVPAMDLGTYETLTKLYTPLPANVSLAVIKADVSKTLRPPNPSGEDTLAVAYWLADSSGKIVARIATLVAEVNGVQQHNINVDPWKNTLSLDCISNRLYPQIKDQMKNGGYASATFTAADFEPALQWMRRSAGELTVVAIDAYSHTHVYTDECTLISVKTTGLYSWFKMSIESAVINGVTYRGEGGAVRVSGPVSGEITLNLFGHLLFIPKSETVTFRL